MCLVVMLCVPKLDINEAGGVIIDGFVEVLTSIPCVRAPRKNNAPHARHDSSLEIRAFLRSSASHIGGRRLKIRSLQTSIPASVVLMVV